jgi:hypothetical protein
MIVFLDNLGQHIASGSFSTVTKGAQLFPHPLRSGQCVLVLAAVALSKVLHVPTLFFGEFEPFGEAVQRAVPEY